MARMTARRVTRLVPESARTEGGCLSSSSQKSLSAITVAASGADDDLLDVQDLTSVVFPARRRCIRRRFGPVSPRSAVLDAAEGPVFELPAPAAQTGRLRVPRRLCGFGGAVNLIFLPSRACRLASKSRYGSTRFLRTRGRRPAPGAKFHSVCAPWRDGRNDFWLKPAGAKVIEGRRIRIFPKASCEAPWRGRRRRTSSSSTSTDRSRRRPGRERLGSHARVVHHRVLSRASFALGFSALSGAKWPGVGVQISRPAVQSTTFPTSSSPKTPAPSRRSTSGF